MNWGNDNILKSVLEYLYGIFFKEQPVIVRNIKSQILYAKVKLESRLWLYLVISQFQYMCISSVHLSWYEAKCCTVGITAKSTERSATSAPVVSRIPVAWRHDASEAITATSRHSCFSLHIFLSVITRRQWLAKRLLAISSTNSRNERLSTELKTARVGEMPPAGLSDRPVIVWKKRISPRAYTNERLYNYGKNFYLIILLDIVNCVYYKWWQIVFPANHCFRTEQHLY